MCSNAREISVSWAEGVNRGIAADMVHKDRAHKLQPANTRVLR
jgi:hypothetical protein